MNFTYRFVNLVIKYFFRLLCKVDDVQLSKVPGEGPLIIAANHINFLEAPVIFTHLLPRPLTGLAKAEHWNNLAGRFLFTLWNSIPIRRGEADLDAFNKAQDALAKKKILAIAPEGTRSHHGQLQRGYPGIVLLALRSHAPIMPLAHYGGEKFVDNLLHFRRTQFNINVGYPFTLTQNGEALSRDVRQKITDEVMYQISALLPPAYRGVYSDLSKATTDYLIFEKSEHNNLNSAIG
jgi:1-acyl-sn-glycerol-3-phosphate acyltransferase